MIQIETLMAVAGALLLVSVFANRISVFLGIPGLLIFIGIGMLAGYWLGRALGNAVLGLALGVLAGMFLGSKIKKK